MSYHDYYIKVTATSNLDDRYDLLAAALADPAISWEQLLDLMAAGAA